MKNKMVVKRLILRIVRVLALAYKIYYNIRFTVVAVW